MTSSPAERAGEDYAEAQLFAARYGLEHEHNRRDSTHHRDGYPFGREHSSGGWAVRGLEVLLPLINAAEAFRPQGSASV
jgi:hypothetical protein